MAGGPRARPFVVTFHLATSRPQATHLGHWWHSGLAAHRSRVGELIEAVRGNNCSEDSLSKEAHVRAPSATTRNNDGPDSAEWCLPFPTGYIRPPSIGVPAVAVAAAAAVAAASTVAIEGAKNVARCEPPDPSETFLEMWNAVVSALRVESPADVDVEGLLEALRAGGAAANMILPKLPGSEAGAEVAFGLVSIRSITQDMRLVAQVVNKHFGHVDLAMVHPLAVRYLLQERSEVNSPQAKLLRLSCSKESLLEFASDLSFDGEFFVELLEHCRLAACAYCRTLDETQEILKSVWSDSSWEIPVHVPEAMPGRPAHLLAVQHPSGDKIGKVVFAIRGTKEIADVLTDALLEPAPFLEGFAHSGVACASQTLCDAYAPTLRAFEKKNYDVVVVGHSIGGATAAAVTIQLRQNFGLQHARCVCFGPPPTVDVNLAKQCQPYVMTVVNDDDFIPRSQVSTLLQLYRKLLEFDWEPYARKETETLLDSLPDWLKNTSQMNDARGQIEGALESHMSRWQHRRVPAIAAAERDAMTADAQVPIATPHLRLPGFVVHMVRSDYQDGYRSARIKPDHIEHINLSPTMIVDHLLLGYVATLEVLAGAADARLQEKAQRVRSILPDGVPQEAQRAVSEAVFFANRFRNKIVAHVQSRPDTKF